MTSPAESSSSSSSSQRSPLDAIDRALLHELQLDGRRSFREIARNIGASEATVRFRFGRLRDSQTVQIVGFADPTVLGYGVLGSAMVSVAPGAAAEVIETVSAWQEAMYVSSTIGRTNVFVQVVCVDLEAFHDLLNDRLGNLVGVEAVESLIEVKVHKAHYVYPVSD